MTIIKTIFLLTVFWFICSCGKVGPLTLPEDKINKTVITYPCNEECQKEFEEEKQRQQSIILQTD